MRVAKGYSNANPAATFGKTRNSKPTAASNAVKRWLGSNQGWLLILENADDLVRESTARP